MMSNHAKIAEYIEPSPHYPGIDEARRPHRCSIAANTFEPFFTHRSYEAKAHQAATKSPVKRETRLLPHTQNGTTGHNKAGQTAPTGSRYGS